MDVVNCNSTRRVRLIVKLSSSYSNKPQKTANQVHQKFKSLQLQKNILIIFIKLLDLVKTELVRFFFPPEDFLTQRKALV